MSVLTASGQPLTREALIADEDAKTLRAYKAILFKYGYKESLWCQTCEDEADHAGCRAYVTAQQIAIECRHRRLYFVGSTS
jgi:hypothetical protein